VYTNILVYSFDSGNPQKCDCAKKLIAEGLAGNSCISFQVVQEFCNAALRKFEPGMDGAALREYQDRVLFPLYSEDLQYGRNYNGLRIVDPFCA
jgi:predicted nucleic acid-binding protein